MYQNRYRLDNPLRLPPAVKWLIFSNVLIFVATFFYRDMVYLYGGLIPWQVTHRFWVWQVVTYMFLHGGFFHLFINLFVLWMFGKQIEYEWGTQQFIKYYLICGIGAAILTIISGPGSYQISIGASGAIYGLLVAFAMLYPETIIYLYFIVPLKAKHFVIVMGIIAFLASMTTVNTGIAHLAHLGGLLTGYVYLMFTFRHRVNWSPIMGLNNVYRKIRDSVFTIKNISTGKSGKTKSDNFLDDEINRILDKILSQGIESLTEKEHQVMAEYTRHKQSTGRA